MKKKELIILNVFLLLVVGFFGILTIRLSINQDLASLAKDFLAKETKSDPGKVQSESDLRCSKNKPLNLAPYEDPQLRKLAQYQSVCSSFVTNKMMFFTSFPEDSITADANATVMATKLKLFAKAGITPIVVIEPYISDRLMSYKDFINGNYDAALSRYFKKLKTAGVTDAMMGTWVPFPESNTPNWNNKDTEPRDFAVAVNRYLFTLKKQFPNAKGSVLLSAVTYEPSDEEWANGDYLSLVPYLQYIDKNLVSSIGIQGFPWISNAATKRSEILRASEFLQPDLTIAAAQELRTRDIWFNTGSFASKYTNDKNKTAHLSLNERKAVLTGILEEVKKIQDHQQNEYRISLNLFSENKSHTAEATDWSYFQNNDSQMVLKEFLAKAEEQNLPISLFDRTGK